MVRPVALQRPLWPVVLWPAVVRRPSALRGAAFSAVPLASLLQGVWKARSTWYATTARCVKDTKNGQQGAWVQDVVVQGFLTCSARVW